MIGEDARPACVIDLRREMPEWRLVVGKAGEKERTRGKEKKRRGSALDLPRGITTLGNFNNYLKF